MALRAGTENKRQVIIASVLGVVALIFLVRFALSYFGPSPAPPAAVLTAPPSRVVTANRAATSATAPFGTGGGVGGGAGVNQAVRLNTNLDPTLHTELMAQAESMTYTGRGRNIFSQNSAPMVSSIPRPIKNIRPVPLVPTGPPPPPPPPPIDLKFYGYSAVKTGAKKAFLLHGEDIFIATEGDVVDRRYRLVKIDPFSVQVEDLAFKDTQTLRLIQN